MPDSQPPPEKSLKERAKELVDEVLEVLGSLVPIPEPELVPVPIRRPRRRYR